MAQLTKEQLKSTKIWIGENPKLSEAVQKRLFELGFKWVSEATEPVHLNSTAMHFWKDGAITQVPSYSKEQFLSEYTEFKEIHLWDLGLSSTGEYDENIGKEITIGKGDFGQTTGTKGIIRDIHGSYYLIYQIGLEETISSFSPCTAYVKKEVENWLKPSEKVYLERYDIVKHEGKRYSVVEITPALPNSVKIECLEATGNSDGGLPEDYIIQHEGRWIWPNISQVTLIEKRNGVPINKKKAGELPKEKERKDRKRFKTKEEFIEEYGKNWRHEVPLVWVSEMDYLLGKYKDSVNSDTWNISEEMLTDKPLPDKKEEPPTQAEFKRYDRVILDDRYEATIIGKNYNGGWYVELVEDGHSSHHLRTCPGKEGYIPQGSETYWLIDKASRLKLKSKIYQPEAKFRPGMRGYSKELCSLCTVLCFSSSHTSNVIVECDTDNIMCSPFSEYKGIGNSGESVELSNTKERRRYCQTQSDLITVENSKYSAGTDPYQVETKVMEDSDVLALTESGYTYHNQEKDLWVWKLPEDFPAFPVIIERIGELKSEDEINLIPVQRVPDLIDLEI